MHQTNPMGRAGACPRTDSTRRLSWILVGVIVLGTHSAWACDLCAIYTATNLRENRSGWLVGAAEQFRGYGTLQRDGEEVPNPAGERLNSSITQFLLGYNVTPTFGLQLNLPLIARVFRRQEATGIVDGNETGIGDLSLLGHFVAFSDVVSENTLVRFSLLGGLKLPSGNSHRLREELSEPAGGADASGAAPGGHAAHEEDVASGIHGHDLALGSGSVDFILGYRLFASWRRLFMTSVLQYAIRREGDFNYQYANDLTWSAGPGVFAVVTHDSTIGVQALLSGESKGNDTLNGVPASDTAITSLFVGPSLTFTWGAVLGGDLGIDLPVVQNNSSLQIVPDFQLRGGVTWKF